MYARYDDCMLFNSYFGFCYLLFDATTLLQLGVHSIVNLIPGA